MKGGESMWRLYEVDTNEIIVQVDDMKIIMNEKSLYDAAGIETVIERID